MIQFCVPIRIGNGMLNAYYGKLRRRVQGWSKIESHTFCHSCGVAILLIIVHWYKYFTTSINQIYKKLALEKIDIGISKTDMFFLHSIKSDIINPFRQNKFVVFMCLCDRYVQIFKWKKYFSKDGTDKLSGNELRARLKLMKVYATPLRRWSKKKWKTVQ